MAVPSEALHRGIFLAVIAIYAVGVFAFMVLGFKHGNPWGAAGACLLASPVPMLLLALLMEQRSVAGVADPARQSWAFLFGDTLFLPFMALMLALGWRTLDQTSSHWYTAWWWIVLSALIGLAAGVAFHMMESGNFDPSAWNSPTKLFHDLVSYPVLFGGLWFAVWPVLFDSASRSFGWWALFGFVLWLAGGVADNTVHKMDPQYLHQPFDWARMRAIPYVSR